MSLFRVCSALLFAVLAMAPVAAQCQAFGGPCNGGRSIACTTAPRIGTTLRICPASDIDTLGEFMLFGDCSRGFVLGSPPACAFCSTCSLHVPSAWVAIPWQDCLDVPVPNDRGLVGVALCAQDVSVRTGGCVCLSNALRITIQ